jgi:hypothetical protein
MTNPENDPMYDLLAAYDYRREAYGDPCPRHGTLRWQADCPDCEVEAEELAEDVEAVR